MTNFQRYTLYTVESHGSSGKWYNEQNGIHGIDSAIAVCKNIKNRGYGVRVIRENDGSVAMSAPYQEPINESVSY